MRLGFPERNELPLRIYKCESPLCLMADFAGRMRPLFVLKGDGDFLGAVVTIGNKPFRLGLLDPVEVILRVCLELSPKLTLRARAHAEVFSQRPGLIMNLRGA